MRVIKDGLLPTIAWSSNGLIARAAGREGDAAGASAAPAAAARRHGAEIDLRAMRISHFFIDRPIFAAVVSIVFVILGGVAFLRLPIAQYPEIAPPIINVTGQYPGASAETVAETVVAPIEQQINGVEGMLYMSSNSTADGRFSISVTFDIGINLDIAQVQVQNRVATATPRLPQQVQQIGVTVAKSLARHYDGGELFSPDKSRDALFISNYANLQIKDVLTRVDGVGSITVFGARDYAMQVWLDPNRLQSLEPDGSGRDAGAAGAERAGRVRRAQPAAGAEPGVIPGRGAHARPAVRSRRIRQYHRQADDRLRWCASRTSRASSLPRRTIRSSSYLNRDPVGGASRCSSGRARTRSRPATAIRATMAEISKRSRSACKYVIIYDPTQFIRESVNAVIETIFEAIILVVLVVDPVPADLARGHHPDRRDPGLADRHVLRDEPVRLHAEQSVAVRARARDRHRGRRRDRRGGECRAQYRSRASVRATPRSRAWTRSAPR